MLHAWGPRRNSLCLVAALSLLLATAARAVPVGVNVHEVMHVNTLHPYDLNGDGLKDIEFQFSDVGAWLEVKQSGHAVAPIGYHDLALPLDAGPITVPHMLTANGGWLDFWPADEPAYFGFDFGGHSAWAYVKYDAWELITLYGMGYETELNTPIAMGAVPEPSAFVAVLIGAAWMAARRKSYQMLP